MISAASNAQFQVHLDSDSRKNQKPDSDSDSSKKSIDSIPILIPAPFVFIFPVAVENSSFISVSFQNPNMANNAPRYEQGISVGNIIVNQ